MEKGWKVIVLIYSGRADPQWPLTKMQANHFLNLLNKAADSEREVAIPSVSGYKGIRLVADEKQFLMYDGVITCHEQGMKFSKKDDEKKIEKYLLSTAPEKITNLLVQLNIL